MDIRKLIALASAAALAVPCMASCKKKDTKPDEVSIEEIEETSGESEEAYRCGSGGKIGRGDRLQLALRL